MLAVLGFAALCACTSQQVQNSADRALNSVASQAPQLVADGALAAQVEARLVGIDPNSALHVALGVHAGNVRLSGKVASMATRAKYIVAVRDTPGVRAVDSRLSIDRALATPRETVRDFALVAAVRANLAAQLGASGLRLRVAAHDGVVTLGGTAANGGLKAAMLETARKTGGVRTIVDRIRVGS
ncbi:MAG: BON domain-containing protein [Candidatus Eremiobacteraeota bacterium]|nr:BON domain-containing protein [Candidatus Eremiobacteraeota bacterium]